MDIRTMTGFMDRPTTNGMITIDTIATDRCDVPVGSYETAATTANIATDRTNWEPFISYTTPTVTGHHIDWGQIDELVGGFTTNNMQVEPIPMNNQTSHISNTPQRVYYRHSLSDVSQDFIFTPISVPEEKIDPIDPNDLENLLMNGDAFHENEHPQDSEQEKSE